MVVNVWRSPGKPLAAFGMTFVTLFFLYLLTATPDLEWWFAAVFGIIVGNFHTLSIHMAVGDNAFTRNRVLSKLMVASITFTALGSIGLFYSPMWTLYAWMIVPGLWMGWLIQKK